MRNLFWVGIFVLVTASAAALIYNGRTGSYCYTGAFLSDNPAKEDVINFKNRYGKKPFLVMVFVDWNRFLDERVIKDVYSQGSVLCVTWEPWNAQTQQGINFDELLAGKYDKYITDLSLQFKNIEKRVFVRFGHEMNGNWYPWAGTKIGGDKFIAAYKYVKDIFDKTGATNVKWIFSVNWEDVPKENNSFVSYYPGDAYVDYIGIDGYNWGNTKPWSRWLSFRDIFLKVYNVIVEHYNKPVLITEFSSTGKGGDKAGWIRGAMSEIKKMKNIKAFVLFNVDKETDWGFPQNSGCAEELTRQLKNPYFIDMPGESL